LAVASSLSLAPWFAQAAGLGKITILSGLGQPLRAELDVTAGTDELAGMTARLAPPDVFRQAGIDYASVLQDLRFTIEKRPGGQAIVKVSSVKPVNEPFLDFLVELNWPAGRLVREYTFLLDPPEDVGQRSVGPEARVVDTVRGGGGKPATTAATPRGETPAKGTVAAGRKETPKEATNGEGRVVKSGDTLRKIAGEMQYEGVSLEQMLVGLYRHNPEAFSGNNMNRLKAGAIIGLPDKETVAAIPEGEAKRVFTAQAADWNNYRQKLAASAGTGPNATATGSQDGLGTITPRVKDTAASTGTGTDQVKVARTDVSGPAAADSKAANAAAEADRIAREKALIEAQARVTQLEKNLADSKKLIDLQNQQLKDLQDQARKAAEKPIDPPKEIAPPKPVEPVPGVETPSRNEDVPTARTDEPPTPVEETVAPVQPQPEQPPEPQKTQPKPKPTLPPEPEPEPEPDMFDALLDNALPLAGGAGALALLAGGYFFYRRRRAAADSMLETTAAPPGSSILGPNSVFRMTGGQSVDTGNTPPQTGDFSQTGPGTIDTDEVDPVAEADVYMAYGRDTQAEEILLEALQKDPQRLAIHAKLLEIYANRRSVKQFETLASELYAQTGGAGPEWEKVAALGADLDPKNPLYSGAVPKALIADANANANTTKAAAASAGTGQATVAMAAGALAQMAATGRLDEEVLPEEQQDTLVLGQSLLATSPLASAPGSSNLGSLDFDLSAPFAEAPRTANQHDVVTGFDLPDNAPPPAASTTSNFGGAIKTAPVFDRLTEMQPRNDGDDDHNFSANGTLLVTPQPPSVKDDFEFTIEKAVADTFVGTGEKEREADEAHTATSPSSMAKWAAASDFGTATQIGTLSGEPGNETVIAPLSFNAEAGLDEQKMAETFVSPMVNADGVEFDVSLTDSVILGEPMVPSEFDMGSINLDLAAEPLPIETMAPAAAGTARDTQWEEVNTKLDLAKAYEEMGDLEGTRELLQEVLAEGPADLVEQARAVLARIGG
jgi:pilus assembly protein FimV